MQTHNEAAYGGKSTTESAPAILRHIAMGAVLALSLSACSGSSGLGATAGAGHGDGTPGGADPQSEIASALDGFVSSGQVSGYGFMMIGKDSKGNITTLDQRWDGTYGANGPTVTLDQPTLLASASKGPAMAAILTLVDQGKLNLDTPVGTYLSTMGITWPTDKSSITLRMLMDHTSGLPGISSSDQPACINVTNLNAATSESMQQCVRDIATSKLDAIPGTQFIYGGADYQVAGYIAWNTAGATSWPAFFQSAVAQPLGAGTLQYFAAQSNPRVAGGAESSVADYAKFLQMLLDGGQYNGTQVLSAASAQAMRTNQIGLLASTPPAGADPSDFDGYGFGFFQDAPKLYSGSPGPEFSDQGLFGATPWIDYGSNYAAILLVVTTLQTGTDMWNAIHPYAITLARQQP